MPDETAEWVSEYVAGWPDEWKATILRALMEQAGGVEVILNPREGVSMRPVDGGPLIIKDGSRALLLPLEGSEE